MWIYFSAFYNLFTSDCDGQIIYLLNKQSWRYAW